MTYHKSGPADPHLLNDSNSDHSTHVNSHEDFRPPSRICAENTLVGGKCPNHPCEKRARDHRPAPNQRLEGRKKHGIPTMPIPTKTQPWVEFLKMRNKTRASLEKYLTSEELDRLGISTSSLRYLWTASVDPPVTKESLSELDLVRIVNDARLRHDVNFDREVLFRPNMQGEVGQRKRALEEGYWDALIIELAIYITRRRHMASNRPEMPWQLAAALKNSVPSRLPRMFRTVQEILKTLVPVSEWCTVDARLDVDLLIQQLDKGVCDILGLSQWLSSLLLGSCSPMRDNLVATMVKTIRQGVEADDAMRIVDGLRYLFAILETMKLDVANHQIRHLRLLMVDDFIHFEQKAFQRRIPQEPSLIHVRSWFQASNFIPGPQANGFPAAQFSTFLTAFTQLITTNCGKCPLTFEHDFDRIRVLQLDYQFCITQAACGQTFIETLHQLGHNRLPLAKNCDDLLNRISSLITSGESKIDAMKRAKDVALEIVRESYAVCNLKDLPSDELLEVTETRLLKSWNPCSTRFQHFDECLSANLIEFVNQEVEAIVNLTPLQILNHLNPPPFPLSHSHCQQQHQWQHWARDEKLQNGLLSIAKRIAHIAVLHWRVWAPILYQQPWSLDRQGSLIRLEPDAEVSSGRSSREGGVRTPSSSSGSSLDGDRDRNNLDFDHGLGSCN